MIKKALWIGIALTVFGFVSAPRARADDWNKATKITFSHPVDVAGHVLVAGTYLFKVADVNDRHIVQIFSADGKTVIATVMTIPDYRLTPTNDTVIRFREVPVGSPEAVRAWFYPGRTIGEEFVYPKQRAIELAKASQVPVPALAVDAVDVAALKTAPIVAVTPDEREVPVRAVIQTTPVDTSTVARNEARVNSKDAVVRNEPAQLPKTASSLPLFIAMGMAAAGLAFGLRLFAARPATVSVR
ncbi:MAG TPA: hypothetical protein VLV86_25030 [Vicinamibacterales bacterium]|nr:hypothetical protein [Vicinamibacterales bacterium]